MAEGSGFLGSTAAEDPPRTEATLRPAVVNLPPTRGMIRRRAPSLEDWVRGLRTGPIPL